MPNFKITFQTGVREKRYDRKMDGILYDTAPFVRVLVAPDQDLMARIAGAMIGEMVSEVSWFYVQIHLDKGRLTFESDALEPTDDFEPVFRGDVEISPSKKAGITREKKYESVISGVATIEETSEQPDLGKTGDHPIPNDQWIWDTRGVTRELGWSWDQGVLPVWATLPKTYQRVETVTIDGVLVSHFPKELEVVHKVGVLELVRGEWKSHEKAMAAVREAQERLKATIPT